MWEMVGTYSEWALRAAELNLRVPLPNALSWNSMLKRVTIYNAMSWPFFNQVNRDDLQTKDKLVVSAFKNIIALQTNKKNEQKRFLTEY